MGKKILIIDDNEGDRILIEEALNDASCGAEIFMAESGEDGVKQALEMKPDIVVTDTRLPGIDGFEVCKKIKADDSPSKVIIITGVVDAVDARRAREAGSDDYVVKTSTYSLVTEAVKKLL